MLLPSLVEWLESVGVPARAAEVAMVRSNEINEVHRLAAGGRVVFVKRGPGLRGEHDRLRWLAGRVPAPGVVAWREARDGDVLVTSAVAGTDLAELAGRTPPERVVALLAGALARFHAVPTDGCPFVNRSDGNILVHGDACLPNILVADGRVTGFIDLGEAGRGQRETDLAAAIWSLQYNFGCGYGARLLAAYGWPRTDDDEVERLRRSYDA